MPPWRSYETRSWTWLGPAGSDRPEGPEFAFGWLAHPAPISPVNSMDSATLVSFRTSVRRRASCRGSVEYAIVGLQVYCTGDRFLHTRRRHRGGGRDLPDHIGRGAVRRRRFQQVGRFDTFTVTAEQPPVIAVGRISPVERAPLHPRPRPHRLRAP